MHLHLKSQPEDFIVEEIVSLPLVKKGDFRVYLLKKRRWNTVDLLLELSRKLKIPFKDLSYGGRKDRYGLTSQFITIKSPRLSELQEESYSLEFIGYMQRPMGPDLIRENRFEVTVRKLSKDEADKALKEIKKLDLIGYPNYFDNQRFGSFDAKQGFLGEKILKQQLNGALKIYLTCVYPEDKKEEKERKSFFFEHWKEWKACRKEAKTEFEIKAFDYLKLHPTGFLALLKQIPHYELSAFIAAYQAFLWNEVLRRLIKFVIPGPFKSYKGLVGDYIFYAHLNSEDDRYFDKLSIPVPGSKLKVEDLLVKPIYMEVLKDNGIKTPMFNKVKLRQAFFKSFERKAIVKPRDLSFDCLDDEVYPGNKKLSLKFRLPRGSYDTMLVKRIFV